MASRHVVTVAVCAAVTQVARIGALVLSVADPLARALLIEVAGVGRCRAAAGLSVADFTAGTVTAVLGRLTFVVAVASTINTALTGWTVRVCSARIFTGSVDCRVVAATGRLLAVLVTGTVRI